VTAPATFCDRPACRRRAREQRLASLGELAGGIAHDLNNVLSGIVGNATLAQLDVDPASDAGVALEDLRLAADRATEFTRQLLGFGGRGAATMAPVDLTATVGELVATFVPSLPSHTRLTHEVAAALPAVRGEAVRLRQLLHEFVLNAAESLGDAGGTIAVRTGITTVDDARRDMLAVDGGVACGDHVFVEVQDTGAGMSAETLDRAFDPYFSTKPRHRGLGLFKALGTVRALRAAIEVSSAPGSGATLRLILPIDASGAASAPATPGTVTSAAPSAAILVVDDESAVRAVTRRLLVRQGFEVLEASSGAQGITLLEQARDRIRCVLLDVSMPGMDGRETYTRMRALVPTVQVVLVSGHSERELGGEFDRSGLAGFLQKPFDLGSLLRAARNAMAGAAG
jgi:two-component system, cell cycle sensor histidine kinase and response regulator CckA